MTRFWLAWYAIGIVVTAAALAALGLVVHSGGPVYWLVSALLPGMWLLSAAKPLLPEGWMRSGPVVMTLTVLLQICAWHLFGLALRRRKR